MDSFFTKNDVVIAVMGVTGLGKSTFISHLPVQSVSVGHGLESCTPVAKPRQISSGLAWHTDDIAPRQESKDCGVLDELPQTAISNDQTSHQNLKKDQFVLCDAGGRTMDVINYGVSYTFGSNHPSPFTFPAKEEPQFGTTLSDYEHLLRCEMNENDTNPNLGDLETVWNSVASHPPYQSPIQVAEAYLHALLAALKNAGFPKGRNVEWGSLQDPSFHHARIGQLFDRDYVWVVTQTMVSFENLALWAVHNVLTYKVYPGFWGRKGN